MRNYLRFALGAIALFVFGNATQAATVEAYKGSRIFWDETTRCTIFSGGGYARVITLQDGRLMAVCESGGIKCSFSLNKGASWSNPQLVASNPSKVSECVPDLIQLSDGTIIVAYNPRPHEPYSEERKFGIRCRRSTDNGKTWSDEIFVNDAEHTFWDGCWEPSMLELPSGELQLYFADEGPYTNSGEQQISLCRSWDKGLTWSKPENISFRAGFRDGMPVPLLLQDQSEIVVAIEDNGWGYGTFFPTTVRTTLADNWQSGYVNAGSANRLKTLDLNHCPAATGGAPYLRQMPGGETILSYQSDYQRNGTLQMMVAVGDNKARNFKALSHPFARIDGQAILWNSVSPLNDSIVLAIGGVSGHVDMVKGQLTQQFRCPYASASVDGRLSVSDGYYGGSKPQVHMGNELGFAVHADFAYDADSLYFMLRAYDPTYKSNGSDIDGIRLSIESKGLSTDRLTTSAYQYVCMADKSLTRYVGGGTHFREKTGSTARMVLRKYTTYYLMEVAIPWSDINLSEAPYGKALRFNLDVINATADNVYTESIPDARPAEPWTWMPLQLSEKRQDTAIGAAAATPDEISISAQGNMLNVQSAKPLRSASIYDIDGRLLSKHTSKAHHLTTALPQADILLVQVTTRDGHTVNRKIKR